MIRQKGRSSGAAFFVAARAGGGRIVWRGRPELVLIGPADERWDLAFIAEHPSAKAFSAMVKDREYRAAMMHRQAAVKTPRLVRMEPLEAGQDSGG
ncbi:DUF1330 domain-containing protein [Maritimibacter fusiformis]|uniref:DUF1330 domain-containing protein n=1 Tax=Maritimibacter fusiformis TaxID=2603819 RepID=UPI001FEB7906|nr:DUF1330 domain-containing protein [Maritimibacter fusiformis]